MIKNVTGGLAQQPKPVDTNSISGSELSKWIVK